MEFARGVVGVLLALALLAGVYLAGSLAPAPIENFSVSDSFTVATTL